MKDEGFRTRFHPSSFRLHPCLFALSQNLIIQGASLNSYTTVRCHRSHCGTSRAETYREFLGDATLDSNRKVYADASVHSPCLKVCRIILRDTHRNPAVSGAHIQSFAVPMIAAEFYNQTTVGCCPVN